MKKTQNELRERIALLEWFKRNGEANREDILELCTLTEELDNLQIPVSWGGKTYSRLLRLCTVEGSQKR